MKTVIRTILLVLSAAALAGSQFLLCTFIGTDQKWQVFTWTIGNPFFFATFVIVLLSTWWLDDGEVQSGRLSLSLGIGLLLGAGLSAVTLHDVVWVQSYEALLYAVMGFAAVIAIILWATPPSRGRLIHYHDGSKVR